jgi:Ca-activated chloride channel family protein
MTFGNVHAIHFFWLLLALVLFYIRSYKKRARDMEKFAQKDLLAELTPSLDKRGGKLKAVLILLSVFMIILSLMRPQWGSGWKEIKRSGIDILIAIDTSKSMLAEDIKPNRLERSKLAVKDLIKKLQSDRIGLIAFSGSAFLQCPLTIDYSGFMLSLAGLNVYTIPKGGTSLSEAIRVALDSYEVGKKSYKILVIISDGEDHEGNAIMWAEKAREQGIKIFTIGIGTKEGDLIPVADDSENRVFLKDTSGNVVKTRLDEDILQKIALMTGGSYVKAMDTAFGLERMYDEKLSRMEKMDVETKMVKRYTEKYQIPLSIALLLLCLEPFISREEKKN